MKILSYPLGQLRANCYIIEEEGECLIIDSGDEAEFILEELLKLRVKPLAILATHGHFDHVMAAGEIQLSQIGETTTPLPFYLNLKDLFLVKRMSATAKHFLGYDPVILPPKSIFNINSGTMKIGKFEFEVIETPGHTPGSVSYYFSCSQALFTGDTLFKEGIGDHSHAYSNKIDLFKSIKKLLKFPEETIIYCGHGEETTVMNERGNFQ